MSLRILLGLVTGSLRSIPDQLVGDVMTCPESRLGSSAIYASSLAPCSPRQAGRRTTASEAITAGMSITSRQ
jgi:hypothetical protein